ncbi:hypothetical protein DL767_009299 [Monosporascus sp. MG133]|nr:hypothetical protein DL767_009299 [Monosporascus sp. MG133]
MASRDTSPEPPRRQRESGTHREHHHKKRKPRDQGSRSRAQRESEGAGSGGKVQKLSIDALAQLNEYNTRGIAAEPGPARQTERRRRRDSDRPRREDYDAVDAERELRRAERRRRDSHRDLERDYDPPRRERERRRRQDGYEDSDRELDTRRRKSLRRREHGGAGVETDIEHDARRDKSLRREVHRDSDGQYYSPRRERRRTRDYHTEGSDYDLPHPPRRERRHRSRGYETEGEAEQLHGERPRRHHGRKKSRVVSGAIVEEGRANPVLRGGAGKRDTTSSYDSIDKEKEDAYSESRWPWARYRKSWGNKKKKRWIIAGFLLVLLIIIIVVAVAASQKNKEAAGSGNGNNSNLDNVSEDTIPTAARGSYLDPFTWYNTDDFNVTYTNETVGGLPVMGLFDEWDDSEAANDQVPALDKPWGDYAEKPARGVNLGGWLSLEPFITPSLFDYDSKLGIIDEWTLCRHLGPRTAAETLEKHYATFVTKQTFAEIRAAGLDHVRIPYSYWAVEVYDDEPYVFRTSWRYLLRGIEWARQHGLRVKLDLHGIPGSQNGWNHSGRWGAVGWLNGTDGELNRGRSLEVHDRLSKFFAQDRYRNVLAFYGLANEPRMVDLPADAVVRWTTEAYDLVRGNGVEAYVVFGDGFMGLGNWQGRIPTGNYDGLVLDVHQYVIFNNDQIIFTHRDKVRYACEGWTAQSLQSLNPATGFGPTMFAEWSQADTDCALHLTNVGWGNRWEGTYDTGNVSTQALEPRCPARDDSCSCDAANEPDTSRYSEPYRRFLRMFAEAQMHSFEKGWGWWYWTWDTESAPLWSYKKGLAAGILPEKAYERDFNCDADVPEFGDEGLSEAY